MATLLPQRNSIEIPRILHNKKLNPPRRMSFDYVTKSPKVQHEKRLLRGNTRTLSRITEFTPTTDVKRHDSLDSIRVTPPPVQGRLHVPVQTGVYLEELHEMIEERDVECQTDPFLDRPSTPLFIPAKTGIDVGTQIEPGELFDFDVEVTPILDAFVGYTLEQALLEVIQEEELAELKEQQRRFEELRACELAERQRLAEQDRRLSEEREQRILQNQEATRLEEETTHKVTARAFARNYIIDLIPTFFHKLEDQGFFVDNIQQDAEETFWPWLMKKVDDEIDSLAMSCQLLDSLIKEAVRHEIESTSEGAEELPPPELDIPLDVKMDQEKENEESEKTE